MACSQLCAQTDKSAQSEAERELLINRLLLHQMEEIAQDKTQMELAKRREAQFREWQFTSLIQEFVERWKDMAEEYNTRGAVNPKKLKAVSKAFRDLEKSDGWLAPK
jgi:hypothetical protein